MIKITILGTPRTKKNSGRVVPRKGGGYCVLPSAQYKAWEDAAGWQLKHVRGLGIKKPVNVSAVFYMPTRRRVDLVNLLEAVDDCLVHYNVLDDDNSNVVASHDGSRVRYDRDNPRVEIEITEEEESEVHSVL